MHYDWHVLTCLLCRESENEFKPEPLLGPKMLALFDYLHVRALFTTKDAMHKVVKSTELNDALQKRIQVHAASRAELQEGLKAAMSGYGGVGHGGGDGAGAATGWNDEVPDDAGACNVCTSF